MYIHTSTCTHMYMCLRVCACVRVHIIYVCIYMCVYAHLPPCLFYPPLHVPLLLQRPHAERNMSPSRRHPPFCGQAGCSKKGRGA